MPLSWGQAKDGPTGQVRRNPVAVARPLCHDSSMRIPRPNRPALIVVVLALTAAVLSLGSSGLNVAEVFLREDLRLGTRLMEVAITASFIAYGLGLVSGGTLVQRYGARLVLWVAVAGWSASTAFLTLAHDLPTLFTARFLMGLSHGAALPAAVHLLTRWVPERRRGLANGVVAFGGRFAQAAATGLTGFLIIAFVPLSTPATITADDISDDGMVMIHTVHAAQFSDIPQTSPRAIVLLRIGDRLPDSWPDSQDMADAINAVIRDPGALDDAARLTRNLTYDARAILDVPVSERSVAESERLNRLVVEAAIDHPIPKLHVHGWRPAFLSYALLGVTVGAVVWLVARDRPADRTPRSAVAVPWRALVTSRNQWLYCGLHFFSNYGWVFLVLVTPWFLANRFSMLADDCDAVVTLALFVGAFAMLAGGVATDVVSLHLGTRWGRALPMGGLKLSCAALMAASAFLPEMWAFAAAVALAAACHDFGTPAAWSFAQDTGGEHAGVVFAWASLWGFLGAALAFEVADKLIANFSIDAAMLTGASALAVSAACGLMANAAAPLIDDIESKDD